ncbi:MAG: ATPase, partial [Actinobacteria bacterium HGW-Actinobacteria-11]
MTRTSPGRSTASRVFFVLLGATVVIGVLVAGFLVVETQRALRTEAERVTAATAEALAVSPVVVAGLVGTDAEAATEVLEPYTLDVIARADLDFITIMTPDGIRITHPDPA